MTYQVNVAKKAVEDTWGVCNPDSVMGVAASLLDNTLAEMKIISTELQLDMLSDDIIEAEGGSL